MNQQTLLERSLEPPWWAGILAGVLLMMALGLVLGLLRASEDVLGSDLPRWIRWSGSVLLASVSAGLFVWLWQNPPIGCLLGRVAPCLQGLTGRRLGGVSPHAVVENVLSDPQVVPPGFVARTRK